MSEIKIRKAGRIHTTIRSKILEDLTKLVENGNILGVTHQQLTDKFSQEYKLNLNRKTIAEYLKQVYKSIPPEDIKQTQIKIEVMFNKIFRLAQDMLSKSTTNDERERAIKLLLQSMDKFIDFLERFGVKPQTKQLMEITGQIDNKIEIEIIKTTKYINANES